MDYHQLLAQRRTHPAWRLLAAVNAPLIASFLHASFIVPNVRAMGRQQLASLLDDHLFHIHQANGEITFPKSALAYLDDWAADEQGWLRKYYPAGDDEAHYDLAPATEQALDWLKNLGQRNFIGTESRLMTVFELLHQIVDGSEVDRRARVKELQRRRAEIDAQIADASAGRFSLLDPTQVRERFLQMAGTARALLSDFRAVDQNFRGLDRQIREQIATWDGSKGDLLADFFGRRDVIGDTDEGRSFRAFWDLLMSPARQDELSGLLERVMNLEPVKEAVPDQRLRRVHYDWLEAGEVTQRTVARLSEQLRRYLDDQAWLENRRIMQLVRGIEQQALALRGQVDERMPLTAIDAAAPDLNLTMERPLFSPPFKPSITRHVLDQPADPFDTEKLYSQVYVDQARLLGNIRHALQTREQISLGVLVAEYPIRQGLAELATYLKLATDGARAAIDDTQSESITWIDEAGHRKLATVPLILYAS